MGLLKLGTKVLVNDNEYSDEHGVIVEVDNDDHYVPYLVYINSEDSTRWFSVEELTPVANQDGTGDNCDEIEHEASACCGCDEVFTVRIKLQFKEDTYIRNYYVEDITLGDLKTLTTAINGEDKERNIFINTTSGWVSFKPSEFIRLDELICGA